MEEDSAKNNLFFAKSSNFYVDMQFVRIFMQILWQFILPWLRAPRIEPRPIVITYLGTSSSEAKNRELAEIVEGAV